MVADYIAVTYSNGNPFGVFAVARAKTGTTYAESMYTTKSALPLNYDAPRFSSAEDKPVAETNAYRKENFYDDEGHRPIPRSRWITNTEGR